MSTSWAIVAAIAEVRRSWVACRTKRIPNLRTKIVNLCNGFLGDCPRIYPTLSRRFNIGIDLVDKIEMYLAASPNITNEFWIADGSPAKKGGAHPTFP
jgi:hypothetical protein